MPSGEEFIEVEESFTFPEDGKKPSVDRPGDKYKYRPLDKVYIYPAATRVKEGPYYIEKAQGGQYSLCDEDGHTVKGGQMYEEKDLVES